MSKIIFIDPMIHNTDINWDLQNIGGSLVTFLKHLHHVFGAILTQHVGATLGVHEDLGHVLDVSFDNVGPATDFSVDRGGCQ